MFNRKENGEVMKAMMMMMNFLGAFLNRKNLITEMLLRSISEQWKDF